MFASTIRVDIIGPEGYATECLIKFLDHYSKYLVSYEISDQVKKPHYQGIVWVENEGAYNAMKKRFSTMFTKELWTRGTKSMAMCREYDTYQTYICKDGNIQYMKNYDLEEIEIFKNNSYKKGEKPIKDNKNDIKVKKTTFQETILNQWDQSTLSKNVKGGMRDRDDIKRWLVTEFASLGKLWDTPVITKYTNFLEYRANPESHIKGLLEASRDRY